LRPGRSTPSGESDRERRYLDLLKEQRVQGILINLLFIVRWEMCRHWPISWKDR
jgi:hypothetical protein